MRALPEPYDLHRDEFRRRPEVLLGRIPEKLVPLDELEVLHDSPGDVEAVGGADRRLTDPAHIITL